MLLEPCSLNLPFIMKIALFAPSDAYLFNFRGALAAALHEAGHEVLMVAPPGPFGARFESLGYRWFPAPMVRAGMNPFKELWLIVWLYRLFGVSAWIWFTVLSSRVRFTVRWPGRWLVFRPAWVRLPAGLSVFER